MRPEMSDTALAFIIVGVVCVFLFVGYVVPWLFPNDKWSDLGRFFKRRKR